MFSIGNVTLGKQNWNTRVALKCPSLASLINVFCLHKVGMYIGHTGYAPFLG